MSADRYASRRSPFGSVPWLIVTRVGPDRFFAVSAVCTHRGCTVSPYDPAQQAIICPCHDSHFAADGTVFGGPARDLLPQYKTAFDGAETLSIELPGLGFATSGSLFRPEIGAARFRVHFKAVPYTKYQLLQGSQLDSGIEWRPIKFALTLNGPADFESYSSPSGGPADLFVEPLESFSFYSVRQVP